MFGRLGRISGKSRGRGVCGLTRPRYAAFQCQKAAHPCASPVHILLTRVGARDICASWIVWLGARLTRRLGYRLRVEYAWEWILRMRAKISGARGRVSLVDRRSFNRAKSRSKRRNYWWKLFQSFLSPFGTEVPLVEASRRGFYRHWLYPESYW